MSHNIDQSVSDTGAMAYVGSEGTPWHGLGTAVQRGATIEEIEQAAGLGWRVIRRPVMFQVNDKQFATDEQHNVLFRSDTLRVLDVCGPEYVPHQNNEVLEFFREYVEAGDMFIDTAGSLNNGEQIWVLAKMDKGFSLPGKDRVEGYVLLMNPHQYGKGMIAKFCATRVVCWNTLMLAMAEKGMSVKIWHTTEFNKQRRQQAKEHLGIAKERLDAIKHDAHALSEITLAQPDAVKLLAKIFDKDESQPLNQQNRAINRMITLWEGAGKGADLPAARGTAWGLLNAVTQYIDHEYGRSVNSRLTNAWLGTGDVQKRKALVTLLAASKAGG